MAISIRIDPESGAAITTCSGILRLNDAIEGVTALWKTPGWSGRSAVWDFREAQFDISHSDIQKTAQYVLSCQPATPPSRVAFATKREVDYGMARIFEAYRQDPLTEFQVFRDYEEAVRWVRSVKPDQDNPELKK